MDILGGRYIKWDKCEELYCAFFIYPRREMKREREKKKKEREVTTRLTNDTVLKERRRRGKRKEKEKESWRRRSKDLIDTSPEDDSAVLIEYLADLQDVRSVLNEIETIDWDGEEREEKVYEKMKGKRVMMVQLQNLQV